MVSALVKKHTVAITDYIDYTGHVDYATKDGKLYSDRLPGTALLMIPFFAFGNLLEFLHLNVLSTHVPIQEVTVILLSNMSGVLGVLFLFLLYRRFNFSFNLSILLATVFALCTLNWQEATHVFSHAPSMCFVLMAFYFLIISSGINTKQFYLFVFLLAYSTVIELQNCLLFIPALVYSIQTKKLIVTNFSQNIKPILISVFIVVGTISILLVYNYAAFGELTLKSNKYNPAFPEEKYFITSLSGNFMKGLDLLFTNFLNKEVWFNLELGTKNDIPGLFVTTPILLLSFLGFFYFFSKKPKEALLYSSIILINILIAAFHKTVLIRHVFTITPFFFFPVVFLVQHIKEKRSKIISISFYSVLILLAVASCYRVFYVTHTYWGRELTNKFPFTKEMGVYLVFIVLLSVLTLLLVKLKQKLKPGTH